MKHSRELGEIEFLKCGKELVVAGTNAQMRRLLGASIVPAKVLHAEYGVLKPPPLENVFVAGIGDRIPDRLRTWMDQGEGRS